MKVRFIMRLVQIACFGGVCILFFPCAELTENANVSSATAAGNVSIFSGDGSLRHAFNGKIKYSGDRAWLVIDLLSQEEKTEFVEFCKSAVSEIEDDVSKAPDHESERFNFYLARVYRILSEALGPIDKNYSDVCREKSYKIALQCYRSGHAGAAEILAQLSENAGLEQNEFRLYGATNGCKTSAGLLAIKFPEPIDFSEDGQIICRLAILDALYSAYSGQYFDFQADAPPPLSSWLGKGELIILESATNANHVSFARIHHDAQEIFNTFLLKEYHENEINLDDW